MGQQNYQGLFNSSFQNLALYAHQQSASFSTNAVSIEYKVTEPIKKRPKKFIAALRDEIDAWHGDILAA